LGGGTGGRSGSRLQIRGRPGQPGFRLVLIRNDGEAEGDSQPAQGAGPLLPVAFRHQRQCPGRQGRVQCVLYLGDDAAAITRSYDGRHPRRRYLRPEGLDPLSRRVWDHGDACCAIPAGSRPELQRARRGQDALEAKDAVAERRGRNPHAGAARHGTVAGCATAQRLQLQRDPRGGSRRPAPAGR
jgi:hypothetical protein